MEGWVALVGWPTADTLPTKWSHVNHRSGIGQGNSANHHQLWRATANQCHCLLTYMYEFCFHFNGEWKQFDEIMATSPDSGNESLNGFRDAVRVTGIRLIDRRIFRVHGKLFRSKHHIACSFDQFFPGAGDRLLGTTCLVADFRRNACELRRRSKCGQNVDGLQQRLRGLSALLSVVVGEFAVEHLLSK